MRPRVLTATLLLTTYCGFALSATIIGTIVGVSDGDTLTVLDAWNKQYTIRLAAIDAPEKVQDFGNRSKQSLSDLAYRKQATVETNKTDRYGRSVGKVIVDGRDVNLEQVRKGMAWHYKAYEREQNPGDREAYATAESVARASKVGLWAMPNPTAPWEFRAARTAAHSSR